MGYFPFWDGTGGINDLAWETCWIGGNYIPGLVTCSWIKPPKRRIEKKPVKGKDGTKVTDQGDELAELLIRTQIYTTRQWVQWQDVLPLLWTLKDGGARNPVEVTHPLPNHMEIKDVYIESISVGMPENQIMVIEIRVFQWKPNPKEVAKAAGRGTEQEVQSLEGGEIKAGVLNTATQAGKKVGEMLGNLGNYF